MELQEALSVAIEYERKVRDHYARCAGQIRDPRGQRIFATLAREEQTHVAYLEARLAEWRATGLLTDVELPAVQPGLAWIEEAAAPPQAGASLPELEFLKQALELEHKTSAFYRDLVALLDPGYQSLFARFLEVEDGHVALVQAEIDALAGRGHWLDSI